MGKPALGKGMRDLITKNFGVGEKPEVDSDGGKTLEELEVLISRSEAQGYDVSVLLPLKRGPLEEMQKGIEAYRVSIKVLASAQMLLRTLEGYGYSKEIESITGDIKRPDRADEVFKRVEELKERAMSEHNIKVERKDSPRVKLPESLKIASQKLRNHNEEVQPPPQQLRSISGEVLDPRGLDSLLENLDQLGDAFSVPEESDPLLAKILGWEREGLFVDRLKTAFGEDRKTAEAEVLRYEEDVKELRALKQRFDGMDLSANPQERNELSIRFQYPHLWVEIKGELDRLSELSPMTAAAAPTGEIGTPHPAVETPLSEVGQGTAAPSQEVLEASVPEAEAGPPSPEKKVAVDLSSLSADELMGRAKDAYSKGNNEEALSYFKELLRKDPENSKAKFMIHRISSKKQ